MSLLDGVSLIQYLGLMRSKALPSCTILKLKLVVIAATFFQRIMRHVVLAWTLC